MGTVTATPRALVKAMAGAIVVVFLALAAWGWFAILREQAPKVALATYGAGLAALLAIFASTLVTYAADDTGLRRKGVFGTAALPWGEIDRYQILRRHGLLTCAFYDPSGKRRLAINFTMLEQNGQPLFELLMRKLPALLPDQIHQWPALSHQEWASPDARRPRAIGGVLLVTAALLGLTLYLGTACGPGAWRDQQLLGHGRAAIGTVVAVLEDEADRGVMYEFTTPEGARAYGTAWMRTEDYPRYVQSHTVPVRYSPADPSRNALEQVLRERRPQNLATIAAFSASLLSATVMLVWLLRTRRRSRSQSRPVVHRN
jgi:hypothetical protein